MKVFVLNKNGRSLMPCKPAKARHLLCDGKAKVVRRTPFTIKLLWDCEENVQELTLGIDPGSKVVGTVVRNPQNDEVVYAAETVLRNDIKKKLDQRKMYRRNRRGRKTRYRACKFNNRKRRVGWLTPTLTSKVQAHKREIKFIFSILPVTKVVYEYSSFDTHKLKNPKVQGFWYQKGDKCGYQNVSTYVLHRDKFKCQCCKGKSKDPRLQVHHIQYRSNGGSNKPQNLITLCSTCHTSLHKGKLEISQRTLNKVAKTNFRDATHVSTVNKIIWEWLVHNRKRKSYRLFKTFGYRTKFKRHTLKIAKTHYGDALVMTYGVRYARSLGKRKVRINVSSLLVKHCHSKGDYQQFKGKHSEKKIPTGKILRFRKYDVVTYQNKKYLIKGRRSSGYFELANSRGEVVKLRPCPKAKDLLRIQARTSCSVVQLTRRRAVKI